MPKRQSEGKAPVSVSQNFLTRAALIRALLARTSLTKSDRVIEIGPGKGHLTRVLCTRCASVTAVEIDAALCMRLHEKLAGTQNLRIVNADFLRWALPAHGPYKVFANIPFSHTTDIIRRLTEARNPPTEAWLIVEHGAALRFIGRPRESLRSLLLKPRFDVRILCRIPRDEFHPRPSVDAALLHLSRKDVPDIPPAQLAVWENFIANNLCGGERAVRRLLAHTPLCAALRRDIHDGLSGGLRYVQWLGLFRGRRAGH